MKKHVKSFLILAGIVAAMSLSSVSFAQPPAPPAAGGNGGSSEPIGGSAPIGGGIALLLTMGAAYGAKKVYSIRKETK